MPVRIGNVSRIRIIRSDSSAAGSRSFTVSGSAQNHRFCVVRDNDNAHRLYLRIGFRDHQSRSFASLAMRASSSDTMPTRAFHQRGGLPRPAAAIVSGERHSHHDAGGPHAHQRRYGNIAFELGGKG
jgi:hypothetical protein